MTRWLISLLLQRILLPFSLIAAVALRQNGLSGVYLVFLLLLPFIPVPTSKTMSGPSGHFQKSVIALTISNIIGVVTFQFVLIAYPPYGELVKELGSPLEKYLRYAGLIRLNNLDYITYLKVLLPEVLVLFASVVTYVSCNHLNPINQEDQLLPVSEPHHSRLSSEGDKAAAKRKLSLLTSFGKYVCLVSMCFAGVLRPSALSGIYFLIFLGSMTWWGLNKTLGKPFAWLCRCLLLVVAGHLTALFLYQMEWAQLLLPSDHPIARYLGFTALIITDVDDPRKGTLSSLEWDSFTNPFALIWLYFILCYESNLIINAPLIRGRESIYRRGTSRRGLIQDSMGSVTITEVPEETIKEEPTPEEDLTINRKRRRKEYVPLKELCATVSRNKDMAPGVLEIILNAGITISQLLAQSSYIATNIIMMAWSITYHSWLTFVLLLWASVMWLMPNQRRAMLRSSPFLVLYATCLLLAQYIYGMNLTNDELPQTIQGVNLKQIGLEKILHLPIKPLVIKILFTVMFWITLKQYNQEKWEARNQSALADIAAPLQIGVGTATGVAGESQTKTSMFVKKVGETCRLLLTKFWIWIVASILFAIGISGDKVTIFRIIYMAMALIFILTFQLSWTIWRQMMYSFWLILILYSMLILVMTYTYQFDNFDFYWEKYLLIPKQLQEDIGLERYETTELFVKLLTPTFFVVITVIQLYYFHSDFLAISDIKSRGSSIKPTKHEPSSYALDEKDLEKLSRNRLSLKEAIIEVRLRYFSKMVLEKLIELLELTCLFLELHMLKLVLVSLMLLSVYDVCALHFALVALIVVGIMFGTRVQQVVVHISSFLISVLFLSKMIYQINYIDHNQWNVSCPADNATYNTAEWFGFHKVDDDNTLPMLLKGYIGVILTITFNSVIIRRQKYQRHLRGRQLNRPFIMFPRISYRDVDNNLSSCIKYLFNYGFYRFGVEICLIFIVTLIGLRMDFYAVLYALWLCLLAAPNRRVLSRIWPFFTLFIVVTIPFQYVLAIGLPPFLCVVYPWEESDTLQRLQEWMFFPDSQHSPPAYKLLCDFIVLLLVCRQGVVFRIERRHRTMEFPGGTNKSIIHQFEEPNFVNPTPDFISIIRSWLDIAKRVVLTGFIWVTLAIVFLAGTNRVNIFSLGYLIGAFIFLWQGNDFYLRPIQSILKWWNSLIGYNVTVILIKTLLQILGCIYIKEMQLHACWAVQILGIACIKKFSFDKEILDATDCIVPKGEVGLAWDGVCFIFLILQRRLFNSYYFFHIVDETKAMTILASRGAELIEDLAQKQIMAQQESEKRILEKIKNKMDRIKASQKKIQGPNFQEPSSHYVAIRSGDYYMFEDIEEQIDLLIEESSESSEELSDEAIDTKRSNVGQHSMPGPSNFKKDRSPDDEDDDEKSRKDDERLERTPSETSVTRPPWKEKLVTFLKFLWAFVDSLLVSVTRSLNKFSRDYRYVMRTLTTEKKQLKATKDYSIGIRPSPGHIWQPLPLTELSKPKSSEIVVAEPTSHREDLLSEVESPVSIGEFEEEGELTASDQPPFFRFILAVWFAVLSHSELVCYFVIFLHQIRSPTILSLPLPLMVFLWATLTVPRPSKKFWVTIIAYTEVVVVVKCIFQFEIIPWNQKIIPDNAPFALPRIIGIERQLGMYAYYDLLLLLVVFFHRSMLKSLGLWKATTNNIHPKSNKDSPSSESTVLSSSDNASPSNKEREEATPSKDTSDKDLVVLEDGETHRQYFSSLQGSRFCKPCRKFFGNLLESKGRVTTDVYAYMFFCDFFNFLVVIFGFAAFGSSQGDGGVSQYFEENKVPIAFLVMLILQFGLIIIDRTLYLRKFILGKIIFQFVLVFGIHIWMFFVLPAVTDRQFNAALPPQMWYMVKCFYLLLSAYQIRCGYPSRIFGNFLCKSYNYINMFLFKVFMAVPFVFELRALMDWIWTDTSMTLSDWLKMEDIFAHVFQLKCQRRAERDYPQPRGEKKSTLIKYIVGGGCLAGIIAVIWFPLVLFALGNTVGQPNIPTEMTASLTIGAYSPLYTYTAQNTSIFSLTGSTWEYMTGNIYKKSRTAQTFLSNYEYDDVGVASLSSHSTGVWTISPPDREALVADLLSNKSLVVKFQWTIHRKSTSPEQPGVVTNNVLSPLNPGDTNREIIAKYISGNDTQTPATLPTVLPKFIKVTSRGTANVIKQLMQFEEEGTKLSENPYRPLLAKLMNKDNQWWEITEKCGDPVYENYLSRLPHTNCSRLVMYTFNDKAFPATLNIISGKGIIGLYTTFVIVIHSVIRGFFTGISFKIMFDDMPNVDRLLQLCLDIYLVRESGELDLEEDLFAKLVFLYRSPETLIKWTRPPEEDDEADAQPELNG